MIQYIISEGLDDSDQEELTAAVVATVVATASMESTSTHARSRLRGFVDTDDTAVESEVVSDWKEEHLE
jgi:hypothetical protein